MATTYDEIRDLFLSKMSDQDLIALDEINLNEIFDQYLKSAIPKFRYCRKNLNNRDDSLRVFNETLSESEKDILSSLCVVAWLDMQIRNKEAFRNVLTTKDFNIHSPANLLKELNAIRDAVHSDVNSQINFYLFDTKSSETGDEI